MDFPFAARRSPRAFTLVEMLVVIAIISLLAAIILPSLVASRRKAHQSMCISNEHQIGQAFAIFLADHGDSWPGGAWASGGVIKGDPTILACPDVRQTGDAASEVPGYAYNGALAGVASNSIGYPALTVALVDAPWSTSSTTCWDPWKHDTRPDPAPEEAWKRHQGGADYLFCDSHVKWYPPGVVECIGDTTHNGVKPGFELN